MSDTHTQVDTDLDPIPTLVGAHKAIQLAVPADQAWGHVIAALNEDSEHGYTCRHDSTATVPADAGRSGVDYIEDLVIDVPYEDVTA